MNQQKILYAASSDYDRSIYLALRAIFDMARTSSIELGTQWSLYGFHTYPGPGYEVVTEYENKQMRMRIKMTSIPDINMHHVQLVAIDYNAPLLETP